LKNKGFKKESMTKVGLYAISKSTTLESNKSQLVLTMIELSADLGYTTHPPQVLLSVAYLSIVRAFSLCDREYLIQSTSVTGAPRGNTLGSAVS
jgi:hypothetical protein